MTHRRSSAVPGHEGKDTHGGDWNRQSVTSPARGKFRTGSVLGLRLPPARAPESAAGLTRGSAADVIQETTPGRHSGKPFIQRSPLLGRQEMGDVMSAFDVVYLLRWDVADDGWGQITAVLPGRRRLPAFLGFVPLDAVRDDLRGRGQLGADGMMQLRLDGGLRSRLLLILANRIGVPTESAVLA